ncbi:hypothetical protein GNZ24_16495 [Burkholderia thailandensis]|nr:hypothetical protein A8H31_25765 [Burkholderia thailandensis]AWY59771.1 hypothetical protein A8H35_16745 [Burkholderia thailandensis]AWY69118.1 hypothetical protein A8H36_30515 [Burkholderia thailandensis]MUV21273.1 hypothetical protein [Burkholderia thailandensis]MUV28593.1 hypothetical protein [Burkholderia thailandensis]
MQEPQFTTVKLEDLVPVDHPLRPLRLAAQARPSYGNAPWPDRSRAVQPRRSVSSVATHRIRHPFTQRSRGQGEGLSAAC